MLNSMTTWLRAKSPALIATIWQWLTWATAKIKASIVALMSSPAVWLACGVVFVGGFIAGHGSRAPTIAQLKADKLTITKARDAGVAREKLLGQTVSALRKQLQEAKDAGAAVPAPESAPAPKRAPAAKKPRAAAKSEAPVASVPFRNPFGG